MNMIKKRQVNNFKYSVLNEVKYIKHLFGIVFIMLVYFPRYFDFFYTPRIYMLILSFCNGTFL